MIIVKNIGSLFTKGAKTFLKNIDQGNIFGGQVNSWGNIIALIANEPRAVTIHSRQGGIYTGLMFHELIYDKEPSIMKKRRLMATFYFDMLS